MDAFNIHMSDDDFLSSTIQKEGAVSLDWSRNEDNEMVILIFHPFVNNITQSDFDGSRLFICYMDPRRHWSESHLTPAYHFFLLKQQQVSMNDPGMVSCKAKKQPQGVYHCSPGPFVSKVHPGKYE